MTGNIIQITPFMHVGDVAHAVTFFTEVLGFDCLIQSDAYAYVEREGAGIRIQWHDVPEELGTPHGGFAYYLDVRDLDAILAELEPKLAGLPRAMCTARSTRNMASAN